nr:immunoglobulin heavy chain junction region [Macaca mulatta]MOV87076.1 immunoglobulin heavy chain junction region [Macaca mulatta]MOV87187.1 immunoglobulin heavy chain junction region [Macaca mulatta]MOV87710.1 immunoglobulin heavy chain junction region [Macaca mulatta]MOV89805.1 immunoglobulin heavy chain junction region [Macaca mulatta]
CVRGDYGNSLDFW